MAGQRSSRDGWAQVAAVLEDRGVTPPCLLTGTHAAPDAYLAHCDAVHLWRGRGDEAFDLADLQQAADTQSVALVLRTGQQRPACTRDWTPLPAAGLPKGWRLFVAPIRS